MYTQIPTLLLLHIYYYYTYITDNYKVIKTIAAYPMDDHGPILNPFWLSALLTRPEFGIYF